MSTSSSSLVLGAFLALCAFAYVSGVIAARLERKGVLYRLMRAFRRHVARDDE